MAMNKDYFHAAISRRIWDTKYRFRELGEIRDQTVEDTWRRVARALASVEISGRAEWEQRFYSVLEGFKFLPGGRIQAGAGASPCSTVSSWERSRIRSTAFSMLSRRSR
jgi:ribonucleoside-diphosphate reductase alpha chain